MAMARSIHQPVRETAVIELQPAGIATRVSTWVTYSSNPLVPARRKNGARQIET
jgi:hypothetical protein